MAVEAALRFGWDRYLGERGGFVGMTGFGASGPADELYELFGITPAAIVRRGRSVYSNRPLKDQPAMHKIVFLERSTIAPQIQLRRPRFEHELVEHARTRPEEVVERLAAHRSRSSTRWR